MSRSLSFVLYLTFPALAAAQRPPLQSVRWSADLAVPDPVSCAVDDQGHVFVTLTTRRKTGDLDIREWPEWVATDVGLESIDQKQAFFHEALAPGRLRGPRASLTDANGDGSVDWKDLTVPTETILRLTDSDGDGKADTSTVFATDFRTEVTGIAAGVLAMDGQVYSTIAPDLWRLTDADGDGIAETRKSLVHGFGHHIAYAGHDMHGLRTGPDGRVYWSIGDKGVNVLLPDGTRQARPHEGCVLRCEPDGSGFEIFAHGLRNVQEIAFDDFGNMFGVDNDADKPGEKERLVYIVEQSDSGWRCAWQYHNGWNPWTAERRWEPWHEGQPLFLTPPLALSHDGPAGFTRNPGTALAPEWRGWFFLNQFPSGKMNALRLEPDGASFRLAEDVPVSSGIMGIGMSWSPDGGLFFADWDGGYPLDGKGAVWRVDVAPDKADPLRGEVRTRLHEGFAGVEPVDLQTLLAHADVRLRGGAQRELARRGKWDVLTDTFTDGKAPQLARLHALWGLGQGLRRGAWRDDAFLAAALTDEDPEARTQAAKIVSETSAAPALSAPLIRLLTDSAPRVRVQAALAIGRQHTSGALSALTAMAAGVSRDQPVLRHAVVTGLAGAAEAGDLARLSTDASSAVRLAACLALARQGSPDISAFLTDADPAVAAEAAWAIHDDSGIPGALPLLAAWLDTAPPAAAGRALRRAVNANYRLGTPEAAARLARYALLPRAPAGPREEALTLLTLWTRPPELDRMDGRPRAYAPRDAAALRPALAPLRDALLALTDPALRALAFEVMVVAGLDVPAAVAAATARDRKSPARVRLEALRLLGRQHPDAPERRTTADSMVLEEGLTAELRLEVLSQILAIDPESGLCAADGLLYSRDLQLVQGIVSLLAGMKSSSADFRLAWLLTPEGNAAAVPAGARLDVIEAATARAGDVPALAAALAVREKALAATGDPLAALADCTAGGDPVSGRRIVMENNAANCVACHRFEKGAGSTVGPPLEAIGRLQPPAYLLQSLVSPSAVIAPGYGLATVTQKDGTTLGGTILSETADHLTLRQPDGTESAIPTATIASRTPPISVMPPMSGILTPRQLRDVVAFLGTLRAKPPAPDKSETGEKH